MPKIKDNGILGSYTGKVRIIEDWRSEKRANREERWAVLCESHGSRRFFSSYRVAKESAERASLCPVCLDFARRCAYCKSNVEQWKADSTSGFTRSIGHIRGSAVCDYHRYGQVPEGISYLQVQNVVTATPVVEISIGPLFGGQKAFTVQFLSGDQKYWINSHIVPQAMSEESAKEYLASLEFAVCVSSQLNAMANDGLADLDIPHGLETWEAFEARMARGKTK